jgi:hypothetical protein
MVSLRERGRRSLATLGAWRFRIRVDRGTLLTNPGPAQRKSQYPIGQLGRSLWSKSRKISGDFPMPTRLAQRRKREAKGAPQHSTAELTPRTQRLCRGCGKAIRAGRTHCGQRAIEGATQRLEAAQELADWSHTRQRREPNKAQHVYAAREHVRSGIPRPSQLGSPRMFSSKRSSPCSLVCRRPRSQ